MDFKTLSFFLVAIVFLSLSSAEKRPLEDRELHCCTIVEYPIVSKDKFSKYNYNGLAFDYLQELENRLGFKCASMYEYERSNSSFTQFTKDMHRCSTSPDANDPLCKCELAIGGWMRTRERIADVIFLPIFARSDDFILTHVDYTSGLTNASFFVSAFTPTVWALIGVVFILFTFVRMMDTRFEEPPEDYVPLDSTSGRIARATNFMLKSRLLYRLRKAAFRTAMDWLQQVEPSAGMHRNSTRQMILTFGVMLAGLFIVLIYESTMTAMLVKDNVSSAYKSIEDLRNCVINPEDICIVKGGAEESYWRNSFAHELCMDGRMPEFIDGYDAVIDMVANKSCKYFIAGNAQTGQAMSGKHCASVVMVGEPVFLGGVSFVMPVKSDMALFDVLQHTTLDLVEQGRLTSFEQYFKEKSECFRNSSESISFQSLRMFFYVALSFIFLMFVFMILDPHRQPSKHRLGKGVQFDYAVEYDICVPSNERARNGKHEGSEVSSDRV